MSSAKALSWSELDCWSRDRDAWFRRYVLGLREEPTEAMERGKGIHSMILKNETGWMNGWGDKENAVHNRIASSWRELMGKRPYEPEVEVRAEICGVPTVGVWDALVRDKGVIVEVKTGMRVWNAKKANAHGQLGLYLLQAEAIGIRRPVAWLVSFSTKTGATSVCRVIETEQITCETTELLVKAKQWMEDEKLWEKRISSSATTKL